MRRPIVFSIAFFLIIESSCSTEKNIYRPVKNYVPDDQALFDTVMKLDSAFFGAYNTCDVNLGTYANFYAEHIEFYHDKGGIMTSKQAIVDATKKNVCGKVTRELDKGSVEVYPIKDYGAIEFGLHRFHNNLEPNAKSRFARFMVIWHQENSQWKISRVVSLH
jgi:ketosteroid isomerase-like protein